MTLARQILTVVLAVLATMATRFLPFAVFSEERPTPAFVQFLGKALPSAVFALLVVYCYRSVDFLHGLYGVPEILASLITIGLHLWRRNMFLSMLLGTGAYMVLIHVLA